MRNLPKLDAKFTGKIIKVKDGSVVPDDEYIVFLAKDDAFADILQNYWNRCVELECDKEQLDAVERLINRVGAWRAANIERCHKPGAVGEKLLDVEAK